MSEGVTQPTIEEHVARLTSPRVVKRIAERTGNNLEQIASTLSTYAAECIYGSRLLAGQLPTGGRILEVGAGLGLLSSHLRLLGHDLTALEPCASGFGFFAEIQSVILEELEVEVPFLHIGAEELNPAQHGAFQFVFSVNVLEHIPGLREAMRGMASVLVPGGRMWHTCPNYIVPYEPHFGIPLLPLFPQTTHLLLPRRISEGELWRSLNFVTYFGLRRLARENNLSSTFRGGTMADALRRLDSDGEFAARQSGIASAIYRILKAVGCVSAIEALPAAMSTPMMVAMEKGYPTP